MSLAILFAAWSWFRPYEWNPDPAAGSSIKGIRVIRDRSFFWVDVHLKVNSGKVHDMMKPVRLTTADGRELEPADSTFGQKDDGKIHEIWFRFWLESQDLRGPLNLWMNEGRLLVRTGDGLPALDDSGERYFTSNRW